jgi:outer membrane lipoprotein-sorting protein
VILLITVALAAVSPPDLETLIAKLGSSQKQLTALSGEFTQRNKLKLFKQELKSTGRFSFSAPRKIRWEYLDPDPSVMTLDGNTATLSAPGSAPKVFDLERDPTMRAIFDQLLLFFGGGDITRARSDYTLATSGTGDAPTLVLTPLATSPIAKAFQKIELRLDPKTMLLRSILLVEKSGDEKEITFGKLTQSTR